MATRPGAVDPGLLVHLLASGIGLCELDEGLSHRSGMLGIFGLTGMREVRRAAATGDETARLAFDVFVRGVSGAHAAMTTSLRGLDAIVFSGGAGERSATLRAAICERLGQLGVRLNDNANARHGERVSAAGAAVVVLVVPVGEEIIIARQTAGVLASSLAAPYHSPS